jgi:hypothetical protein
MDRKDWFALAPALLGIAATVYVTQGQNTWVKGNTWLGPLLLGGTLLSLLGWQWDRRRPLVRFIRAKFRGERIYMAKVGRLRGSRLELLSGLSMTTRPKGTVGYYDATTIGVRNAETRFNNRCEGLKGTLHFKHAHIAGQEFTKEAWFVRGDIQEFSEPAVRSVDLRDGESARIVLLVSGPRGMAHYEPSFYVLNEAVFHSNFQPALETGEWNVTVTVQSKLEADRAAVGIHLKLERTGSLSMGFVRA